MIIVLAFPLHRGGLGGWVAIELSKSRAMVFFNIYGVSCITISTLSKIVTLSLEIIVLMFSA